MAKWEVCDLFSKIRSKNRRNFIKKTSPLLRLQIMSSGAEASSSNVPPKGKEPSKPKETKEAKIRREKATQARKTATKAMATLWGLKARKIELEDELEKTNKTIRELSKELGFAEEPAEMTEVVKDAGGEGRIADLKRKAEVEDAETEAGRKRKRGLMEKAAEHEKKVENLEKFRKLSEGVSTRALVGALAREGEEGMEE